MKKIILMFFLLLSMQSYAHSVNYTCVVRYYQISITLNDESTSMFLTDRMTHDTLYVGYVSRIVTQGKFQKYYFYPSNGRESILTFNADDVLNQVDRTSGWIDGQFNGFLIYDAFTCLKNRN